MGETPHGQGERIYQGAEAILTAGALFGRRTVVKLRRPKGYRIPALETSIARGRMRNEARLMERARRAGVDVPRVLDADPEERSITLEYLGRNPLRDEYEDLPTAARRATARKVGSAIGLLHRAGLIHGDLTTSNMVVRGGRLHLFDFSLGHISLRIEDRAVDLKAFKDSFRATHLGHASDFDLIVGAYRRALGVGGEKVIAQIANIERRRRYA